MSSAYHYNLAVVLAIIGVIALAVDDYVIMFLTLTFGSLNVYLGWKEEENEQDES